MLHINTVHVQRENIEKLNFEAQPPQTIDKPPKTTTRIIFRSEVNTDLKS